MAKRTKPQPPKRMFTFYPGNKIANRVHLTAHEMRQRFQKWLPTMEIDWLQHYGSEIAVVTFITAADGLNATFEKNELPALVDILKPDFMAVAWPESKTAAK